MSTLKFKSELEFRQWLATNRLGDVPGQGVGRMSPELRKFLIYLGWWLFGLAIGVMLT